MNKKQFAESLALYGARIEQWPQALQAPAVQALQLPGFQHLAVEAEALERALLQYRPVVPARTDLASRIVRIVQALEKAPKPSLIDSLRAAFEFLLPNPALVLASMLAVGCAIGLSTPSGNAVNTSQENILSSDANGDIL